MVSAKAFTSLFSDFEAASFPASMSTLSAVTAIMAIGASFGGASAAVATVARAAEARITVSDFNIIGWCVWLRGDVRGRSGDAVENVWLRRRMKPFRTISQ